MAPGTATIERADAGLVLAGLQRTHAAIVAARYVAPMLAGEKFIEARLARSRRLPFGRVAAGDEIFFRATGAACFAVRARVERVETFAGLTPTGVRGLRRRFNHGVLGTAAFWHAKLGATHATLIWLVGARAVEVAPRLPDPGRSAWACV